jgi:hypothetical protein
VSEKNGSGRELSNEELDKVTGGLARYSVFMCVMVGSDSEFEKYYKQGDNCTCPDWQPSSHSSQARSCRTCYCLKYRG